jgi:hypothetical protein
MGEATAKAIAWGDLRFRMVLPFRLIYGEFLSKFQEILLIDRAESYLSSGQTVFEEPLRGKDLNIIVRLPLLC